MNSNVEFCPGRSACFIEYANPLPDMLKVLSTTPRFTTSRYTLDPDVTFIILGNMLKSFSYTVILILVEFCAGCGGAEMIVFCCFIVVVEIGAEDFALYPGRIMAIYAIIIATRKNAAICQDFAIIFLTM